MFTHSNTRLRLPPRARHAVCVAALSIAVAGCGKHAPSGQTVATVNGTVITQSELNMELSAAGLTGSAPADVRNKVLQSMIDRTLVDQQAKKDGIDKTPEFVLIDKRAHDILLAQRAMQTASAGGQTPPRDTEINDYLDKHPALGSARSLLTIDQVKFAAPGTVAEAKAFTPAKTMDQLIAVLQSQGKQFEHGQTIIDSAQVPDTMLGQIRKTTSGEPLLIVQGATAVANVLVNEKANPANSSDAADLAKKRIMAERTQASLRQRQASLRQTAQIQYATGFAPKVGEATAKAN